MGICTFCLLVDEYHEVTVIPVKMSQKREWDEIKFPIGGKKYGESNQL